MATTISPYPISAGGIYFFVVVVVVVVVVFFVFFFFVLFCFFFEATKTYCYVFLISYCKKDQKTI